MVQYVRAGSSVVNVLDMCGSVDPESDSGASVSYAVGGRMLKGGQPARF